MLSLIDDVLIYGKDKPEHNSQLEAVLERIRNVGVTLNTDKCKIGKSELTFLGYDIDERGIRADPGKKTMQ